MRAPGADTPLASARRVVTWGCWSARCPGRQSSRCRSIAVRRPSRTSAQPCGEWGVGGLQGFRHFPGSLATRKAARSDNSGLGISSECKIAGHRVYRNYTYFVIGLLQPGTCGIHPRSVQMSDGVAKGNFSPVVTIARRLLIGQETSPKRISAHPATLDDPASFPT